MGDQPKLSGIGECDLNSHVDIFRHIGVSEANQINESMFASISESYQGYMNFCQEISENRDRVRDFGCTQNPTDGTLDYYIKYIDR